MHHQKLILIDIKFIRDSFYITVLIKLIIYSIKKISWILIYVTKIIFIHSGMMLNIIINHFVNVMKSKPELQLSKKDILMTSAIIESIMIANAFGNAVFSWWFNYIDDDVVFNFVKFVTQ